MKKRIFLLGALLGSSVAILTAPHSGKKTRSKLKYKGVAMVEEVKSSVKKSWKCGNKHLARVSKRKPKQTRFFVIKSRDVH